jgi:hypothetical protein
MFGVIMVIYVRHYNSQCIEGLHVMNILGL